MIVVRVAVSVVSVLCIVITVALVVVTVVLDAVSPSPSVSPTLFGRHGRAATEPIVRIFSLSGG